MQEDNKQSKFVPVDKMSKKNRKAFHSRRRANITADLRTRVVRDRTRYTRKVKHASFASDGTEDA